MFDPESRTLILSFNLLRGGVQFPQVYIRDIGARSYRSISELANGTLDERGLIGVGSPVLGGDSQLYTCITAREETAPHGRVPIEPIGIAQLSLRTQTLDVWRTSLWFAAELLGCGPNTGELYATVGGSVVSPEEQPAAVGYSISLLDWQQRTNTVIGMLDCPFY